MNPDQPTISESLFARAEKPASKFFSPVSVLNLFIILKIVSNNESRPTAIPLSSTNLLFSSSSNDSELMSVSALNNNICFLISKEVFDFEVTDKILVVTEFVGDVVEVFDSHFFA